MKHDEIIASVRFLNTNLEELEAFINTLSEKKSINQMLKDPEEFFPEETLEQVLAGASDVMSDFGCRIGDITDSLKSLLGGFDNGNK